MLVCNLSTSHSVAYLQVSAGEVSGRHKFPWLMSVFTLFLKASVGMSTLYIIIYSGSKT